MIQFDLPQDQSSILKVIGVGGGGSNAVNHMFAQNIVGVDFIICNTDAQAIAQSKVPNKIQLGPHLTQGLGAGANPNIGRQATEESLEEIKRILEVNTKMAFITAGMGGGTGTGGAPILAKICKDLGILTVGIVTTPFAYEGKRRIAQAEEGIMLLKSHVDTLLVISNDKLRHQFGNLKMKEAFAKADNVLATAAKCITDVINSTGQINVDFSDVCTVMSKGGVAILGSATAAGEDRAQNAIERALNSPLLNDDDIRGAKWILININSSEGEHEFTMDEVEVIQNYLLSQAGEDSDVILGLGYDNTLGEDISITLIATGFQHKDPFLKHQSADSPVENKADKITMTLDMTKPTSATLPMQPMLLFEMDAEGERKQTESTIQELPSPETQPELIDPMMPVLRESQPENTYSQSLYSPNQPLPDNAPEYFNLDLPDKKSPTIDLDLTVKTPVVSPKTDITIGNTQNQFGQGGMRDQSSGIAQGRFLSKPSQIYAEPKQNNQAAATAPEEIIPMRYAMQEQNNSATEMKLVEREDRMENEHIQVPRQVHLATGNSAEILSSQLESDELKRRTNERISKLRNLSFNINAADPNNDFETIPAYLRRPTELQNQTTDIENFYSNYTVKSDDNNQAEIGTINNYLSGKRPD
jgi:cell division protein FtsZ